MDNTCSTISYCSAKVSENDARILQSYEAEIVFGSPAERNCSGIGLCRILPLRRRSEILCPSVVSRLILQPNGRLKILLLRNAVPEVIMHKQFSTSFFRIESTFNVPKWLLLKLGIKSTMEIRPGSYTVVRTGQYLSIEF